MRSLWNEEPDLKQLIRDQVAGELNSKKIERSTANRENQILRTKISFLLQGPEGGNVSKMEKKLRGLEKHGGKGAKIDGSDIGRLQWRNIMGKNVRKED